MKTLHPIDDATLAKIGKAYLICAGYPEVFGEVRMDKFCSMFVDVIPDDDREAKIKFYAPEMYETVNRLLRDMACQDEARISEDIRELSAIVDCINDEEA